MSVEQTSRPALNGHVQESGLAAGIELGLQNSAGAECEVSLLLRQVLPYSNSTSEYASLVNIVH